MKKISNDEYQKRSVDRETKDYEGISSRLIDNGVEVLAALNQFILAAQKLDEVVKKKTYYGKAPKYYHAPLFKVSDELSDEQKARLKDLNFIRLIHGFMGIATESGEGIEALAQFFNGKDLDLVNIGEELGDNFWYSALIADTCGTDFTTEMTRNDLKLAKRHGKKYNDDKVMDRDLKEEREILKKDI